MIMTEEEQATAIKLYGIGYSFQEIAQKILYNRNAKVFMPLVKEVREIIT